MKNIFSMITNKRNDKNLIMDNTEGFCKNFEEIVKQTDIVAVRQIIKHISNTIQGQLYAKLSFNDKKYGFNYFEYVKNSLLLDKSICDYGGCLTVKNVSSTPIISIPWNSRRAKDTLIHIGNHCNNPFDGYKYTNDICCTLIKPLGLVLINNGMHRLNSAIIYNEGKIVVKQYIDITSVLKKYKFDGIKYIDIKTQEAIKSDALINGSEPFFYEFGLLFNMASILTKYNIFI